MRSNGAGAARCEDFGFEIRDSAGGARVVTSRVPLPAYGERLCDDLVRWALEAPDRAFLCERSAGAWRALTYGEALRRTREIGSGLLRSGASSAAPLGVIADNGIEHALVALGAMYVGLPVAPISSGYAAPEASPARLRDVLSVLQPGALFAGNARIAERFAQASSGVPILRDVAALASEPASADVAFGRVSADTIAKIMFTSGSTGVPKGVVTTNRMLCANVAMETVCWPEVSLGPPVVVDWLPWSHCFGGNHNFDLVLRNGGTLFVDEGKPAPGAFAATVANLRDVAPTLYFSVPRGFALLVEELNRDAVFARHFFSRLQAVCNAGASLPGPLRLELIRLARECAGAPVRIVSSWGTTETAPLVTTSWGPVEAGPETIGTPAPGVELKFAPLDGRFELRVRGPNVTPGYWRNPGATQEAFDEDGFYRTGDAGILVDGDDPARGVSFGGRLAENFKLSSGTWVNVGAIRLALLEHGAPLVEDVVVAGHDRDELTALVFIGAVQAAALAAVAGATHADLARHGAVRDFIARALARYNRAAPAGSTRIARALILPELPNRDEGEITDKGSVNQRRALSLRAASVERLYEPAPDPGLVHPAAAVLEPGA